MSSVKAGLFTFDSLGETAVEGCDFSEIDISKVDDETFAATYEQETLLSGDYFIRFELFDAYNIKLNSLIEFVKIKSGCISSKTYVFVALSAINTNYKINYCLNGGEWNEGFTPVSLHNVWENMVTMVTIFLKGVLI